MNRLLRHPAFPRLIQLPVAAIAAIAVTAIFSSPDAGEYNAGSMLLWLAWWPLAALSFPTAGRIWCAVCPTSLLADLLPRTRIRRFPAPAFLIRHEIGVFSAVLALFYLLFLWFDFEANIGATRALLAYLASAALLFTLLFRERVWCRSLCPAGILGGLLARLAPRQVFFEPGPCRNACGDGSCGVIPRWRDLCPTIDDPGEGIDPRSCIMCGNCIKECPAAFDLAKSLPIRSRGAWWEGTAEAAACLLLAGIGLDGILLHLRDRPILFWQASSAIGIEPGRWAEIALHTVVVSSPAVTAAILARATGPGKRLRVTWRRLGQASLPLAAAAVTAPAMRDLLIAAPRSLGTIRPEWAGWLGFGRQLDGLPILLLQGALVAGGMWAAFDMLSDPPGEPAGRSEGMARAAERGWCLAAGFLLLWLLSRPVLY